MLFPTFAPSSQEQNALIFFEAARHRYMSFYSVYLNGVVHQLTASVEVTSYNQFHYLSQATPTSLFLLDAEQMQFLQHLLREVR